MREIPIEDILNYKIVRVVGYTKGGFYLIHNHVTNMGYVGKSTDYMGRLKYHTYKCSRLYVDIELKKNIGDFRFYLLYDYNELGINFFTRKLESIVEHRLITRHNTAYPNGFNIKHYANL